MSGRKAIVGLCMLCALVFSAVARAGRASGGHNNIHMRQQRPRSALGRHCLGSNRGHGETQGWEHVDFPNGEVTHAGTTNTKTKNGTTEAEPGFLRTVVGGVAVELKATEIHGTGHLENSLRGTEHIVQWTGTITFSQVTVSNRRTAKSKASRHRAAQKW